MKKLLNEKWFNIYGLLAFASFLGLWQLAGYLELIDPIFVGTPLSIAKAGSELIKSPDLYINILASMQSYLLGFFLAIVIGVGAGLIIGTNKPLNQLFSPFISALHATPIVAIVPLLILWFGYGTRIIVIFLMALIPILINTIDSAKSADESLIKMSQSYRANKFFLLKTIILPGSLPFILSGIRIAGGRSVIGLIVGEFFGVGEGIGFLMNQYSNSFQTDKLMFIILIMIGINLIVYKTATLAEKKLVRWKDN